MNIQNITELAHKLQNEMPFLSGIHTEQENNQALELMERLIEDYENEAPELAEFNNSIKNLNAGSSMLRLLMEQHGLNTTLFANEIGGKSTVSMICNGKRKLTVEHIEKLSQRFEISPALFF